MVRYTIVDSIEANPSDGRISIMSPLGKNLLGKQIKDIILWGNGARIKQMQLVRIT
jgi:transcription elongation GreA/GreB family factor